MEPLRPPRIVDLVFAPEPAGGRRRLVMGGVTVLALYAGAFVLVSRLGRAAGSWSADLAARIHDAVARERAVDITPPPPPPPLPAEPPPLPAEPPPADVPRVVRTTRVPVRATRPAPAAPAQAGQLAAASPEPVDFTGSAFIMGTGSSYAGGATTGSGTSRTPAYGNVAPGGSGGAPAGSRSRARPVSLDQGAWNCPWPAEADAQQVNEQTVVLQAAVGADGRAERVDVVSDPGFGFGAAARLCALRTRFEPAHDPAGHPLAAMSPPIRVHFFR